MTDTSNNPSSSQSLLLTIEHVDFDAKTGTIKSYKSPSQGKIALTIPVMLDGKAVKNIGKSAFAFNQLTSVIIPELVTNIGESALAGNNLTNVTIPESVTYIGKWAFDENPLTNVSIPVSLVDIGDNAFGEGATVTRREKKNNH